MPERCCSCDRETVAEKEAKMASKAAEIRLSTTRASRRHTSYLKKLGLALKEWGRKGQLTGYSETELSRQTGSRI
jgi:hypothetical protein